MTDRTQPSTLVDRNVEVQLTQEGLASRGEVVTEYDAQDLNKWMNRTYGTTEAAE